MGLGCENCENEWWALDINHNELTTNKTRPMYRPPERWTDGIKRTAGSNWQWIVRMEGAWGDQHSADGLRRRTSSNNRTITHFITIRCGKSSAKNRRFYTNTPLPSCDNTWKFCRQLRAQFWKFSLCTTHYKPPYALTKRFSFGTKSFDNTPYFHKQNSCVKWMSGAVLHKQVRKCLGQIFFLYTDCVVKNLNYSFVWSYHNS